MRRPHLTPDESGFTLIEMFVAINVSVIMVIVYGGFVQFQRATMNNFAGLNSTETGRIAINKVANVVRDMSNSWDNVVQAQDASDRYRDDVPTSLEYLAGDRLFQMTPRSPTQTAEASLPGAPTRST